MKSFKIVIICISMLTLFSTMAFATAGNNGADGGDEFTISDSGTGPGLTFTPSPTTLVAYNMDANTYAITTVSAKTNAANGRQYGVVAGKSPIYELAAVVSNAGVVTITPPATSSTLGNTWLDKAGNTAP